MNEMRFNIILRLLTGDKCLSDVREKQTMFTVFVLFYYYSYLTLDTLVLVGNSQPGESIGYHNVCFLGQMSSQLKIRQRKTINFYHISSSRYSLGLIKWGDSEKYSSQRIFSVNNLKKKKKKKTFYICIVSQRQKL